MKKIFSRLSKLQIVVLVIVVIVAVAVAGIYTIKSIDPWKTYASSTYGLQFNYLKAWGQPTITEHKLAVGKSYDLNFKPKTGSSPVNVSLQDASSKYYVCSQVDPDCPAPSTLTKATISKRLSQDKKGLAAYDNDSYAILLTDPQYGLASMVNIFQAVDLPKLNVTAVKGSYTISTAANSKPNCSTSELASDAKSGCVSKQQYNDLAKLLKSIKAH